MTKRRLTEESDANPELFTIFLSHEERIMSAKYLLLAALFLMMPSQLLPASASFVNGPTRAPGAAGNDEPRIVEVISRVEASEDDADEKESEVDIDSDDLDMGDHESEIVGVRFSVDVPKDAIIVSASIQFHAQQRDREASTIVVYAEDTNDATAFKEAPNNISSRGLVATSVEWNVDPWFGSNHVTPSQKSPNLARIVQKIVEREGWVEGQHIAFILKATSERDAISYDRTPLQAAALTIRYVDRVARSGKVTAGIGRADITPPPGLPSFGYSLSGQSLVGLRTRLYARALFIESSGDKVVLVQCDLGAISAILHRKVVAAVEPQTGLTASRVLISATHTHAGPGGFFELDYYNDFGSNKLDSGYDPTLVRFLTDGIRDAILEAYYLRGPAALGFKDIEVFGLTRNRSIEAHELNCDVDGSIPPVDQALTMLRVDRLGDGKRPLAAFTNFPIHGTAIPQSNDLYSGDVHAHAQRHLEWMVRKHYTSIGDEQDFLHLLTNSNEGDVSPNYDTSDRRNAPYDEADELGRRLAARAFTLFKSISPSDAAINVRSGLRDLSLPSRLCSHDDIFNRKGPLVGAPVTAGTEDGPSDLPLSYEGDRLSAPVPCHGLKKAAFSLFEENSIVQKILLTREHFPQWLTIQIVRLGDLFLAAVPGEMTTQMGRRMKNAVIDGTAASQVVLVGLANQFSSYFTTPEEYEAQHYEGGSNLFGRNTGDFLREKVVQLTSEVMAGNVESLMNVSVPKRAVTHFPAGDAFDDGREERRRPRVVKRPEDLGFSVSFEWTDHSPGSIEFNRPLVEVQVFEDGAWVTARDESGIRQDDRGVSIEIRIACNNVDSCERWRATWFTKTLDPTKRYRFRIFPRFPFGAFESSAFSMQ